MLKSISISSWDQTKSLFVAFLVLVVGSIFAATLSEIYFIIGIPVVALIAYLAIVDFKQLFFLLIACIPFSVEFNLPGGFGTDLPTEPLIIGLMLVYLLYFALNFKNINGAFFKHPITLILLLHWGWIFISIFTSSTMFVSMKYFLAKSWYIITFYFLAGVVLKNEKNIKRFFYALFIPLTITIIIVLVRHAAIDFSFKDVNYIMGPFYRNHVNYASIVTLAIPLIWMARNWYPQGSGRRWMILAFIGLYIVAIQFSYTRAAILSLMITVGFYFVIKFRLTKICLTFAVIGLCLGIAHLYHNNNYIDYAPNFERTISHKKFDNLVEATYKMEDISTMERVYRWVAGANMVDAKPIFGFGPGNFYNYYKSYTVQAFVTYVSDNPEKSSVHSYYLLVLIDQGLIGFLIFILLIFTVLIKSEEIYHNVKEEWQRRVCLATVQSFVVILALLLINDMVETDKVGSFFFICMAILVNLDSLSQSKELSSSDIVTNDGQI